MERWKGARKGGGVGGRTRAPAHQPTARREDAGGAEGGGAGGNNRISRYFVPELLGIAIEHRGGYRFPSLLDLETRSDVQVCLAPDQ